jgi:uncharacterized FAD-dependent dehydrogenase
MIKEIEIDIIPESATNADAIKQRIALSLGLTDNEFTYKIFRRSIDARGKNPLIRCKCQVFISEPSPVDMPFEPQWQPVHQKKSVIIVGAGPGGYFAALQCIILGLKPIIIERGKDVRARRRDLKAIQQQGLVDADSNYCFGEGGAGTYSDGKLYTRSHKRGSIENVLQLLVNHGAHPDILIDAHPHIGSNKLPQIVANIRNTIVRFGGEVYFEERVIDFITKDQKIVGVISHNQKAWSADAVILATGHSARDIFFLLGKHNILVEQKPFALGVRIEHPQPLIDKIQYGKEIRPDALPASSYKLVTQVENRGVFSFCMCPGGLIVPAATAPGEIVINGMSMSRRDSPFANAGTVVAIESEDLNSYRKQGVFAGLAFQQEVEQKMFSVANGTQKAPAQRLTDFIDGKWGDNLPKSSYIPGLTPASLHALLPDFIYRRLKKGLMDFGKKMNGYHTAEAVVVAIESRTSSPLRIPRDPITKMHPHCVGLFPCGEGAGYAGGILSAAMDGQNVASAVAHYLYKN